MVLGDHASKMKGVQGMRNGVFPQIPGFVSKTTQDTAIVTRQAGTRIRDLSSGAIFNDFE